MTPHTSSPAGRTHGLLLVTAHVPPPTPDVVPQPPSPHPVHDPSTPPPPEVDDPVLPGQDEPVREPVPPVTSRHHPSIVHVARQ